ncbi:MAG: fatty acid desaturase [Paracoccaceae bacterium]
MQLLESASRTTNARVQLEGPTLVALIGCYGLWITGLWIYGQIGPWALPVLAIATAFHSSLQHEILHGHPTRSASVNEALIFPALGLFIPYRRFRDLHLRHHNDERLTDPYDDPESFYLPIRDWHVRHAIVQSLLLFNGTFLGRMIVGPGLALAGFWRAEAGMLQQGDKSIHAAWIRHALGMVPVLGMIWLAGIPIWLYIFGVAYPALSLIMVRSYIEHRAAEQAPHRTVVVEGHWFWSLLFLNNNFHAIHHEWPSLPWYSIPKAWRARRDEVLDQNAGYYYRGYGEVARQWLLRPREPVVHPFVGHGTDARTEKIP